MSDTQAAESLVQRIPPRYGGLALGLIFLALMWLLLAVIFHFGDLQHTRIAEQRLMGLVSAAAALVDGNLHETLREPDQTGSAEYQRLIDPLVDFHNQLPDIYWLYTMRVVDGKLRYVLDTAQSPRLRYERDPDLISAILDEVTDYTLETEPELLPTISAGHTHLDRTPSHYGDLLLHTAQAPILDSEGRVVAMLAADIEVNTFRADQRRFMVLILGAAVASLLIAVAIALLSTQIHRRLRDVLSRLEHEGITDALTGLYNRAHFNRTLQTQIASALRHHQPLTLLIFDIDHFKLINDRFGHAGGDLVLRNLGARLREVIRSSDVCCRIGGEEFALLMPGASAGFGREAFARLSAAIRQPLLLEGEPQVTTVSGGIAQFDETLDADELMLCADKALYRAKEGGRDQVVVADCTSRTGATL